MHGHPFAFKQKLYKQKNIYIATVSVKMVEDGYPWFVVPEEEGAGRYRLKAVDWMGYDIVHLATGDKSYQRDYQWCLGRTGAGNGLVSWTECVDRSSTDQTAKKDLVMVHKDFKEMREDQGTTYTGEDTFEKDFGRGANNQIYIKPNTGGD